MDWLSDNISTIIIALVLAAVVAGVIAFMAVRRKKAEAAAAEAAAAAPAAALDIPARAKNSGPIFINRSGELRRRLCISGGALFFYCNRLSGN